jgi:Rod binding domain-containing protein
MLKVDLSNVNMSTNKVLSTKESDIEDKTEAELKGLADEFESLLLKTLLDITLKNENSLFPKQAGSDIYKSMYNEELSKELSGSFGYSELLFNYLKDIQKK